MKNLQLELLLLKARSAMLAAKGAHNIAIVNHINRRIRNIERLLQAEE